MSASGQPFNGKAISLVAFKKNKLELQQTREDTLKTITMYSTRWCSDCRKAQRVLRERNIAYQEIDIDENEAAARQVIEWSGGRRVIPTIVFERQSTGSRVILHNPPLNTLEREIDRRES
jgi:mycoredoxin